MPNKIFNIRMRNKRDTEANWEKKNPLILDGEIIVVTTTSGETRVKIGDGAKTYTQLPFLDEVLKNESKSLGLTSATVGQIPKVKAVDSNGVPTEWEATAMPSGGAGNMKKLTFTGAVTGEYDGTTDVSVDIPIATSSTAGVIKVGNGLSISADGTLSVTTATYYTGTADPVNTLGADGDLYLKTEG